MKIAVTYEDGNVFQHFGHSEEFKIYDVEDGNVVSTEIFSAEGSGHDALATLLNEKHIDVLICGGIGNGAQRALAQTGIELVSGACGPADKAVERYLGGNLESEGVNCDHHDNDGGGCGGHCSSCGGGCGTPQVIIEGKNAGKKVKAHYRGTLNDGSVFDSSYDRNEPIAFTCGVGQMIKGFDEAVVNMEVGDEVDIHLMPEEAYGMPDPEAIFSISFEQIPSAKELNVGERVSLIDDRGMPCPVSVVAKDETSITFDANHEMAGKELNFHIELVEVL